MIHPDRLADMRRHAQADALLLTDQQRHALAAEVLALGYVARRTLADPAHAARVLELLDSAAPTLALELRRILAAASILHRGYHRDTA